MHSEPRTPSRLMLEHRGCEQVGYAIAGDDCSGGVLDPLHDGDVREYIGSDGLCSEPSCT